VPGNWKGQKEQKKKNRNKKGKGGILDVHVEKIVRAKCCVQRARKSYQNTKTRTGKKKKGGSLTMGAGLS